MRAGSWWGSEPRKRWQVGSLLYRRSERLPGGQSPPGGIKGDIVERQETYLRRVIGTERAVELLAPPSLGRYWVSGARTLLRSEPKPVWGKVGLPELAQGQVSG